MKKLLIFGRFVLFISIFFLLFSLIQEAGITQDSLPGVESSSVQTYVYGVITCDGVGVSASITVNTSIGTYHSTSTANGNYGGIIGLNGSDDIIHVTAVISGCGTGYGNSTQTGSTTEININVISHPETVLTPTPRVYELDGYVVDLPTGEVVEGAYVMYGNLLDITDEDGYFNLGFFYAGELRVNAFMVNLTHEWKAGFADIVLPGTGDLSENVVYIISGMKTGGVTNSNDEVFTGFTYSFGNLSMNFSEGTRITLPDGNAAEYISIEPATGLPSETNSTLIQVVGYNNTTYTLEPSGIVFSQPVNLTLGYDPDNLPEDYNPDNLHIAIFNPDTDTWQVFFGGEVNTTAHTITIQITHLSTYAATYMTLQANIETTTTTTTTTTITTALTTTQTEQTTTTGETGTPPSTGLIIITALMLGSTCLMAILTTIIKQR